MASMNGNSFPNKPGVPPANSSTFVSGFDQQSMLPSLCQVIAMTMSYRRLAVVWATVPFLCVVTPMVVKVLLVFLNTLTQGMAVATVLLAGFLVLFWYHMVRVTAPSVEKEREAYQKSRLRLPFAMFWLSFAFLKIMLRIPGSDQDQNRPDFLFWSPTIVFGHGLRIALGLSLAGAAVLMKFVGYNSVGACYGACDRWPRSFQFHTIFLTQLGYVCLRDSSMFYHAVGVQSFSECFQRI